MRSRGTGANSFRPPAWRRVQARRGRCSVPLAGSQRSVHFALFADVPAAQYVIVSDDLAAVSRDPATATARAVTAAMTATVATETPSLRMHSAYASGGRPHHAI